MRLYGKIEMLQLYKSHYFIDHQSLEIADKKVSILKRDMSDTRSYSSLVTHDTTGYVGFANLPNQVHRKSVKKGFEFTLMVAGESGLGKSTLIDSLFLTDLYGDRDVPR